MADFPLDSVHKSELLTVKRDFAVSPDELLAAFTAGEVFKQWYAPEGWRIMDEHFTFEPRIGGRIQLLMEHEAGIGVQAPIYLRFESITDGLIEFTESIAGPTGQPTDQLIGWRLRFTPGTVVTESGVGQGTNLVLEQGPLPESVHEQARETWHQSFSNLEKVLTPQG
ncbi:SRPBCC family protein [Rothia aerolata]|uniref:Activator of Hsp90 ATPase homologue 1/2-like C-terminal domain-containing protein n=1 Tax=Rothia aerolata TaxID=1812262 RepID=A0A917IWF5_9MICC|nr:SRPBCC domain-containing protein [Rothia aerolata]GGH65279.1 hypothetical protein GCM10007359_18340 [Rothia aerolata]